MNIKTLNNLGFVEANKIVIDLVNTLHIISDNELEDILELKDTEHTVAVAAKQSSW